MTSTVTLILSLFYSSILVLIFASMWTIFEKAGKAGWKYLIPIYNTILLLEIVGKPWWWIFLLMLPFVNIIWAIWMMNLLSKSFGKNEGFTVGLILLGIIFFPILAFGNAKYLGPAGSEGFDASAPLDVQKPEYNLENWLITISMFLIINAIFWFVVIRLGLRGRAMGFLPTLFFGAIPLITAGLMKNKGWRIVIILTGTIFLAIQIHDYLGQFLGDLF